MDKTTIIIPKRDIVDNDKSYWAIFFCSILKAIRYQKNLGSNWGGAKSLKEYKGELRLNNFFSNMKNTIKNHAFEYVMVDFLKTNSGIDAFKLLCDSILKSYGVNDFYIRYMNVFKVGTDSEVYRARVEYSKTELTMLLPKGVMAKPKTIISDINGCTLTETLNYSDLFIVISDGKDTFGFVGEVEGNNGEDLFSKSYFNRNARKDKYCSFGIAASDKKKHGDNLIKGNVSLNMDEVIGRWILNFSKSSDYVTDYYSSIEAVQSLIEGHFSYMDSMPGGGRRDIVEIIKNNWSSDINELMHTLESFIDYAMPIDNFHYQEIYNGKVSFRPSSLIIPGAIPLYDMSEIII